MLELLTLRTSDSLNERLPIKMVRTNVQENDFFHEKDSRFYPRFMRRSVVLIGQVPIKNKD